MAQGLVHRILDSDVWWSFRRSKVTMVAATVTAIMILSALFATQLAPQNPFDPGSLLLMDSFTPPVWEEGGSAKYLLGTDSQGRDLFSAILYGARVSLIVGFASVLLAMTIGITLGVIAGYVGGTVDAVIMRIAEVQLSFPTVLVALLINGVARGVLSPERQLNLAIYVLILSLIHI